MPVEIHIDTDGVLTAMLEKSDSTPLTQAETTSLTLYYKNRETFAAISNRSLTVASVLHATSGLLTVPLLASEIATAVPHRVIIRGVKTDGKKFILHDDFNGVNEETA